MKLQSKHNQHPVPQLILYNECGQEETRETFQESVIKADTVLQPITQMERQEASGQPVLHLHTPKLVLIFSTVVLDAGAALRNLGTQYEELNYINLKKIKLETLLPVNFTVFTSSLFLYVGPNISIWSKQCGAGRSSQPHLGLEAIHWYRTLADKITGLYLMTLESENS